MDLENNRIQKIMKKQGLTQQDLSEMTGIHRSDISEIIAGKKKRLTLVNAFKIANALGYSIEYVWNGLND